MGRVAMNACPQCGTTARCQQSIAGSVRPDGRTYRRYLCNDEKCAYAWSTRECHIDEVTPPNNPAPAPPQAPPQQPPLATPTPPSAPPMLDLETEMESILPDAVEALRECVRLKEPSRARVEAAWRVISDRREYRVRLAQQANITGDTPNDPRIAELAGILRLVPDQEAV